jgi:hypothetical protein
LDLQDSLVADGVYFQVNLYADDCLAWFTDHDASHTRLQTYDDILEVIRGVDARC